ncbi:KamA family radical SAM protein [Chloroflexota bacterium]
MDNSKLRIGFAYDSPVDKQAAGPESVSSEYEDTRTIDWIYNCLSSLGEVIRLPWGQESLAELINTNVDVIFNITEAGGGRNRESLVPAVAEALGIPHSGTDALGLGLSLDKYLTKVIASHNGIPTPPFYLIGNLSELDSHRDDIEAIGYPLFVKPVTGGSSMGIRQTARVESFESLRNEVRWVLESCRDSVLIEKFIPGREFCVGLLETDALRYFPVAELRLDRDDPHAFYSYEMKSVHRKEVICPAEIPEEISAQMQDYSQRLFNALDCRDLARVDFRLGEDGTIYFLEINPLPGLSPFYSIYTIQAEAAGIKPESLIESLVRNALARAGKSLPKENLPGETDSWEWQETNTIRSVNQLWEYIHIDSEQEQGIKLAESEFSWHITPYYAGLMDMADPNCPIRMQAVPQEAELLDDIGVMDPLDEEKHNPAPNIIKVYPDRIAWTISNKCAVLCRHCLRKRMVGREQFVFSEEARDAALEYIARSPEIRDVLITGGDPLMYSDEVIDDILGRLRKIPHVEIVRIGSRVPCTMPQRITDHLCRILKKHHPLYFNTQFNHPKELTEEARIACGRLADAGIPLGNQSVLLRGVNDDPSVMKALVQGLVRFRVRPYYIYQAQTLKGASHFITPIERGIEIIESLRGHTSGLAVPVYLLDTPYGKIPMNPDTIVNRDDNAVYLRSWTGNIWREPNRREG